MRKLIISNNEIEWISFDKLELPYIDNYRDYIKQINLWSNNEDMKKFISESPVGNELDLLFREVSDTDLYIGVHGDEVIAAALLGHTRPIAREAELINYIKEKRYLKPSQVEDILQEEFLDEAKTFKLLEDKENDNIYIEYLLVNPKYHGRGIATKFYKTLKDNLEFFNGSSAKFLQVSINELNLASRKSILKNGFMRMKPVTTIPPYSTYYLHLKENHITKDII